MARPKFKIKYEEVTALASIMCTQVEIAAYLGCSVDTLQRDAKFKEVYEAGLNTGRSSLRRLQWTNAQNGNTTMQIWLGKQMLDQKQNPELAPDENADSESLEITYNVKKPKGEVTITKGTE